MFFAYIYFYFELLTLISFKKIFLPILACNECTPYTILFATKISLN
jgi:hypothetical protein